MVRERTPDPLARPGAPARVPAPLGPGDRLLNRQETAALFGVSLRTLQRLVATGELHCVRVGRLVRFHPGDVSRWLSAHTE
jgi:excisionase family DNA binding protein